MASASVVVMGVSGSGKSTVGAGLAHRLRVPFCEGDTLHPAANIAKMHAGHPLDDADRAPWLKRVHDWLRGHAAGGVITCSALKRSYRDQLRSGLATPPRFVLLDPPREVLSRRLADRQGHFMPASLLDSQLATLGPLSTDERGLRLEAEGAPGTAVEEIVHWLRSA